MAEIVKQTLGTAAGAGVGYAKGIKSGKNLSFNISRSGISVAKGLINKAVIPETNDNDVAVAQSYLGTPVYANLVFGNIDNQNNISGAVKNEYIDLQGNIIPFVPLRIDSVIMTARMQKNIIKTPIQGRNGTIKEYISDGDYIVDVVGTISTTDQGTKASYGLPEDDIERLINICNIPYPLPVDSTFLNLFGIDKVVIENYMFPQEEGFRNRQKFQIQMVSHQEIDLNNVEA